MITVCYFASIREQLGRERETLALPEGVQTVAELIQHLVDARGESWRRVLLAEKVLVARNQEVVGRDARLAEGDEVAFFPPVTGG